MDFEESLNTFEIWKGHCSQHEEMRLIDNKNTTYLCC